VINIIDDEFDSKAGWEGKGDAHSENQVVQREYCAARGAACCAGLFDCPLETGGTITNAGMRRQGL